PVANSAARQVEDLLQQLHTGIANGELRGVDTDCDATGAGIAVIPGQCDLTALVEPPRLGQGERVCRNHEAAEQCAPKVRQAIAIRNAHPPPRSAWACSVTIRRPAPSAPPIAAEAQKIRPARRVALGSGSNH